MERASEIGAAPGLIRVLLVEPDESAARRLEDLLSQAPGFFEVVHVPSMAEAKRLAARDTVAVVLLSVSGGESHSLESALRSAAPRSLGAPVILLARADDESAAQAAVLRGLAHDYLVASHLDPRLLAHALCYTLERRRVQVELRRLRQSDRPDGRLDRITGLPNRQLFHDRLETALEEGRHTNQMSAVFLIGLDGFRLVQDTLGPSVADPLLQGISRRLTEALGAFLRPHDTLARLSGEEFAVVFSPVAQMDDLSWAADAVLEAFAGPFRMGTLEFFISCSIGISVHPFDGTDAASMLQAADVALRRSREQGGSAAQFYLPAVNDRYLTRLELQNGLRIALARDQFLVHYMPQRDVATGRIVSVEALARWKHPSRGMIPPSDFIPLAEETGLILPLGERVLRQACLQARAWQSAGLRKVRVSVNVSPRQFQRQNPVALVRRILEETKLDPGSLELEITESAVMKDADAALETLRGLKAEGVGLAIDDFGTGYSSLSYLRSFPIDALKVDRSFVREVPARNDDAAIVTAIIAMAHSLRLRVIAEGVETPVQHDWLRARGCHEIQGYLVSRPLPADSVAALLKED